MHKIAFFEKQFPTAMNAVSNLFGSAVKKKGIQYVILLMTDTWFFKDELMAAQCTCVKWGQINKNASGKIDTKLLRHTSNIANRWLTIKKIHLTQFLCKFDPKISTSQMWDFWREFIKKHQIWWWCICGCLVTGKHNQFIWICNNFENAINHAHYFRKFYAKRHQCLLMALPLKFNRVCLSFENVNQ